MKKLIDDDASREVMDVGDWALLFDNLVTEMILIAYEKGLNPNEIRKAVCACSSTFIYRIITCTEKEEDQSKEFIVGQMRSFFKAMDDAAEGTYNIRHKMNKELEVLDKKYGK